ncbi:hypothetical protein LCI18_004042 [Fusarium solani-melongenae]|uniref:Uncharacterized protein n=1 Tax=Fusarium solani subsp. cucurbitae TaxID=2747967 RepID=A0ACD3YVX1_FUSSC|nr:hypothetical protein LCI18_004042 [Fusarium solani-melongenae]
MPPVRTAKQTKAASDAAPVGKRPNTMWLKPIPKGHKEAFFKSSERDWDDMYEAKIGTATKVIKFGSEFTLTDRHVDDILSLGPGICGSLWKFIFEYTDVTYGAKNKAKLTTQAVVRLAKACPKLRRIELQAATQVGEDALLALFENCPALTYLELSGISSGNGITGTSLDALRENPEWAPKLKMLILGEQGHNKEFMKAMRALGKERQAMATTLASRCEEKNWGDWDVVTRKQNYKKGRKHRFPYDDAFGPTYGGYNRFW